MAKHKILMLGASAGGIEAICKFLGSLPTNLNITIIVTIHLPSSGVSLLERVLARCAPYPVLTGIDELEYKTNHIYLSPVDQHLLIDDSKIHLTTGPKINRFRPSIDIAFKSAAINCGERIIGVLFTGLLWDGVQGLNSIKENGGVTIVQDPDEAVYPDLPLNALAQGIGDHILPIKKIARLVTQLAKKELPSSKKNKKLPAADLIDVNTTLIGSEGAQTYPDYLDKIGKITAFTCPDCSGTLWEIRNNKTSNYRCRIGHQYNLESLLHSQTDSLENILWSAIRALEESHNLSKKIAEECLERKLINSAKVYFDKAEKANQNAQKIRKLLLVDKSIFKKIPI
jgi:two-component system chemotaxis response regulator CheB